MNRPDFNAKCSNCNRVYSDHTNDEIDECVREKNKSYDGTLESMLVVLSKANLAKKFGQPGQVKKEFAVWPTDGSDPVVSSIPTRDFGIFFLCNQGVKNTKKDKEDKDTATLLFNTPERTSGPSKKDKEDKDAKEEGSEHTLDEKPSD
jgi:hypothetical protein